MALSKLGVDQYKVLDLVSSTVSFKKTVFIAALLLISAHSEAFARDPYEVRIQCPGSNGYETVRFYADDDVDAFNQAQKALNRSDFKRKKCTIIEIRRN